MRINNILFLHSSRTGGTNFEKTLGFKGHGENPRVGTVAYGENSESLMGFSRKNGCHLTHGSYQELVDKNYIKEDNKLIKVSILRSPYDRVVSLYKYFGGKKKWGDFHEFLGKLKKGMIKNYFYRPQYENIVYNDQIILDECISFNNYSMDVDKFSNKYNLNLDIKFQDRRQYYQTGTNFIEFYKGNKNRILVEELYEKDFIKLNF
tara:strand:+ start:24661 stop:25278 length:618 start_codon:yes stop_codon:yes gene_type:complete